MAMQYLCKFQKYVIECKSFLGYLERGNACALNIPMHEQYPFGSLDQNNLAHVGRVMHHPSKFEKICYGAQCIFGITYKGYCSCIV
jgi:hypothetical protein